MNKFTQDSIVVQEDVMIRRYTSVDDLGTFNELEPNAAQQPKPREPDDIYIVGTSGQIFYYNGVSWAEQDSTVGVTLYAVTGFKYKSEVVVVGTSHHHDNQHSVILFSENGIDWTEIVPPSDATYVDVWGTDKDNIWAVSSESILHWNGSIWYINASLNGKGIWGTSWDNIYLCSEVNNKIYHYDGSSWSEFYSGCVNPRKIWGIDENNIWVVGNGIWFYDGATWTKQSSNSGNAIWGYEFDNVFVCGNGGNIYHFDGVSWSSMTSPTIFALNGVYGTGSDEIFIVGQGSTVLRYDGVEWTDITVPGLSGHIKGVWGCLPPVLSYDNGSGTDSVSIKNLNATAGPDLMTGSDEISTFCQINPGMEELFFESSAIITSNRTPILDYGLHIEEITVVAEYLPMLDSGVLVDILYPPSVITFLTDSISSSEFLDHIITIFVEDFDTSIEDIFILTMTFLEEQLASSSQINIFNETMIIDSASFSDIDIVTNLISVAAFSIGIDIIKLISSFAAENDDFYDVEDLNIYNILPLLTDQISSTSQISAFNISEVLDSGFSIEDIKSLISSIINDNATSDSIIKPILTTVGLVEIIEGIETFNIFNTVPLMYDQIQALSQINIFTYFPIVIDTGEFSDSIHFVPNLFSLTEEIESVETLNISTNMFLNDQGLFSSQILLSNKIFTDDEGLLSDYMYPILTKFVLLDGQVFTDQLSVFNRFNISDQVFAYSDMDLFSKSILIDTIESFEKVDIPSITRLSDLGVSSSLINLFAKILTLDGYIEIENIATGDGSTLLFEGFLTKQSIIPDNFEIFLDANLVAIDDGFGNIFGIESSGDGITGSINYITGEYSITFNVIPEVDSLISIKYEFDNTISDISALCLIDVSDISLPSITNLSHKTLAKVEDVGTGIDVVVQIGIKPFDVASMYDKVLIYAAFAVNDFGTHFDVLTAMYNASFLIDKAILIDTVSFFQKGFVFDNGSIIEIPNTFALLSVFDSSSITEEFLISNQFTIISDSGQSFHLADSIDLLMVFEESTISDIIKLVFNKGLVVDYFETITFLNIYNKLSLSDISSSVENIHKLVMSIFVGDFSTTTIEDVNIISTYLIEDSGFFDEFVGVFYKKLFLSENTVGTDYINIIGTLSIINDFGVFNDYCDMITTCFVADINEKIEIVATGDDSTILFIGFLSSFPVNPNTIEVQSNNIFIAADDGEGNLIGDSTFIGTINYITGEYHLEFMLPENSGNVIAIKYNSQKELLSIFNNFLFEDTGIGIEDIDDITTASFVVDDLASTCDWQNCPDFIWNIQPCCDCVQNYECEWNKEQISVIVFSAIIEDLGNLEGFINIYNMLFAEDVGTSSDLVKIFAFIKRTDLSSSSSFVMLKNLQTIINDFGIFSENVGIIDEHIIEDIGNSLSSLNLFSNIFLSDNSEWIEKIITGDGSTLSFSGILSKNSVRLNSVEIRTGNILIGIDDGFGNLFGVESISLSGTIDYTTGEYLIVLSTPPSLNSEIYLKYEFENISNELNSIVTTSTFLQDLGEIFNEFVDIKSGSFVTEFGSIEEILFIYNNLSLSDVSNSVEIMSVIIPLLITEMDTGSSTFLLSIQNKFFVTDSSISLDVVDLFVKYVIGDIGSSSILLNISNALSLNDNGIVVEFENIISLIPIEDFGNIYTKVSLSSLYLIADSGIVDELPSVFSNLLVRDNGTLVEIEFILRMFSLQEDLGTFNEFVKIISLCLIEDYETFIENVNTNVNLTQDDEGSFVDYLSIFSSIETIDFGSSIFSSNVKNLKTIMDDIEILIIEIIKTNNVCEIGDTITSDFLLNISNKFLLSDNSRWIENIATGDGSTLLFTDFVSKVPVKPFKVKIFLDNSLIAVDDGIGNVVGTESLIDMTGSINYTTGFYFITFDIPPVFDTSITLSYEYINMYDENINVLNTFLLIGDFCFVSDIFVQSMIYLTQDLGVIEELVNTYTMLSLVDIFGSVETINVITIFLSFEEIDYGFSTSLLSIKGGSIYISDFGDIEELIDLMTLQLVKEFNGSISVLNIYNNLLIKDNINLIDDFSLVMSFSPFVEDSINVSSDISVSSILFTEDFGITDSFIQIYGKVWVLPDLIVSQENIYQTFIMTILEDLGRVTDVIFTSIGQNFFDLGVSTSLINIHNNLYVVDLNDEVELAFIGDESTLIFSNYLSKVSIQADSVKIKLDDTLIAVDDGYGNIFGINSIININGIIDYKTGSYSLTFNSPPYGNIFFEYSFERGNDIVDIIASIFTNDTISSFEEAIGYNILTVGDIGIELSKVDISMISFVTDNFTSAEDELLDILVTLSLSDFSSITEDINNTNISLTILDDFTYMMEDIDIISAILIKEFGNSEEIPFVFNSFLVTEIGIFDDLISLLIATYLIGVVDLGISTSAILRKQDFFQISDSNTDFLENVNLRGLYTLIETGFFETSLNIFSKFSLSDLFTSSDYLDILTHYSFIGVADMGLSLSTLFLKTFNFIEDFGFDSDLITIFTKLILGERNERSEMIAIGDDTTLIFTNYVSVIPIIPTSVQIILNTNIIAMDDGEGNLIGDSTFTGTIDYVTGEYLLTFSSPPEINSKIFVSYMFEQGVEGIERLTFLFVDDLAISLSELKYYINYFTNDSGSSQESLDVYNILSLGDSGIFSDEITEIISFFFTISETDFGFSTSILSLKNITLVVDDLITVLSDLKVVSVFNTLDVGIISEFINIYVALITDDIGSTCDLRTCPDFVWHSNKCCDCVKQNECEWSFEQIRVIVSSAFSEDFSTIIIDIVDVISTCFIGDWGSFLSNSFENIIVGDGSTLAFTNFVTLLSIIPNTIEIKLDNNLVATDDGSGNIFGVSSEGIVNGSIDYMTGEYHINFSIPPDMNSKTDIYYKSDQNELLSFYVNLYLLDDGRSEELGKVSQSFIKTQDLFNSFSFIFVKSFETFISDDLKAIIERLSFVSSQIVLDINEDFIENIFSYSNLTLNDIGNFVEQLNMVVSNISTDDIGTFLSIVNLLSTCFIDDYLFSNDEVKIFATTLLSDGGTSIELSLPRMFWHFLTDSNEFFVENISSIAGILSIDNGTTLETIKFEVGGIRVDDIGIYQSLVMINTNFRIHDNFILLYDNISTLSDIIVFDTSYGIIETIYWLGKVFLVDLVEGIDEESVSTFVKIFDSANYEDYFEVSLSSLYLTEIGIFEDYPIVSSGIKVLDFSNILEEISFIVPWKIFDEISSLDYVSYIGIKKLEDFITYLEDLFTFSRFYLEDLGILDDAFGFDIFNKISLLDTNYERITEVGIGDGSTLTFTSFLENPKPNTVQIMSNGDLILVDNGYGNLIGDSTVEGTIDYITGECVISFIISPEIGIEIIAYYLEIAIDKVIITSTLFIAEIVDTFENLFVKTSFFLDDDGSLFNELLFFSSIIIMVFESIISTDILSLSTTEIVTEIGSTESVLSISESTFVEDIIDHIENLSTFSKFVIEDLGILDDAFGFDIFNKISLLDTNYERITEVGIGDGSTIIFTFFLESPLQNVVRISLDGNTVLVDDGYGNLIGDSTVEGTIDYITGECVVSFITPPEIGIEIVAYYFEIAFDDIKVINSFYLEEELNLISEELLLHSLILLAETYDFLPEVLSLSTKLVVVEEGLSFLETVSYIIINDLFDNINYLEILQVLTKITLIDNYYSTDTLGIFTPRFLQDWSDFIFDFLKISQSQLIKDFGGSKEISGNLAVGDGSTSVFASFLTALNILPNTVRIMSDNNLVGIDDGFGNIFGIESTDFITGTINYLTGEYYINFFTPPVVDSYIDIYYLSDQNEFVSYIKELFVGEDGFSIEAPIISAILTVLDRSIDCQEFVKGGKLTSVFDLVPETIFEDIFISNRIIVQDEKEFVWDIPKIKMSLTINDFVSSYSILSNKSFVLWSEQYIGMDIISSLNNQLIIFESVTSDILLQIKVGILSFDNFNLLEESLTLKISTFISDSIDEFIETIKGGVSIDTKDVIIAIDELNFIVKIDILDELSCEETDPHYLDLHIIKDYIYPHDVFLTTMLFRGGPERMDLGKGHDEITVYSYESLLKIVSLIPERIVYENRLGERL